MTFSRVTCASNRPHQLRKAFRSDIFFIESVCHLVGAQVNLKWSCCFCSTPSALLKVGLLFLIVAWELTYVRISISISKN